MSRMLQLLAKLGSNKVASLFLLVMFSYWLGQHSVKSTLTTWDKWMIGLFAFNVLTIAWQLGRTLWTMPDEAAALAKSPDAQRR